MAVSANILTQNIVIVTENINPALFNMLWFVNNNIYKGKEILPDSVFVPGFTSLSTNDSQITIVPNQIQMSIKNDNIHDSLSCIQNHFEKMMAAIQSLPVKAIGINFVWKVTNNELNAHDFTSYLFGADNKTLYKHFSKEDSRLGAYFSQNYDKTTRLKLDLKPVSAVDGSNVIEFVLASFNYHSDIDQQNPCSQLMHQLQKWNDLRNDSNQVVCLIK